MSRIFIGMLLVFFDFNLDIGASRIGLIPDFIGFAVMSAGVSELRDFSGRFVKIKPFVTGMIFYAALLYILNLIGLPAAAGILMLIPALIATVLSLYISYSIIMGIRDIETGYDADLNSARLYTVWKILAAFTVLSTVLVVIPGLMIICTATSFIAAVVYLFAFNKSKNMFYALDI